MRFLFFIILLPFPTHASWLCREASSRAQDNTFYACGHAEAKTLSEAREQSLNAAKREFHAFCNESRNCRDYAYNITPMRTDCNINNGKHSCYRGLEYTILNEKKSSKYISKVELETLLEEKEQEVREIHNDIRNLERIDELDNATSILSTADNKEVEYEYLKNHVAKDYNLTAKPSAFSFLISGTGIPTKDKKLPESENVFLPALGGEFNQILWRNISLRVQISFLTSIDDDDKTKKTFNKPTYHSYTGTDLNLGLPIQFDFGYITPHFGVTTVKYKSTTNTITQLGAINTQESDINYNSNYFGVGARIGSKFFLEVSPRYYLNDNKFSAGVSIGINFGY